MEQITSDYVVVGSGPAGAAIAELLSEDRGNSVVLLEAGDNNDEDQQITDSTFAPVLQNLFFPQYFWQGEGVPQDDLNNRTFRWTGGRLLGGSSSVNRQLYVRPTPAVIRRWQALLGPIWSVEEVIERFRRLERYNGRTDNPGARGFRGHLDVRQAPAVPTPTAVKLVRAIEQATGFQEVQDYNNPDTPIGPFTRNQYTQKPNGTRESASTAFLSHDVVDECGHGVRGRRLTVLTNSTVLRIVFDGRTACGVEFLWEGQRYFARARRKTIISAGIKSPHLLMVSGIGPGDELEEAGIDVVLDNPNVGQHLANHSIIPAVFSVNPDDPPVPPGDPNAHLVAGAFLPDPMRGSDPTLREVQIEPFFSGGSLIVGISPVQPRSRGSVRIQNGDPLKIELGDEGFLDDPEDLRILKDTFEIYIRTIATKLNAIDPKYQLLSPAPEVIDDEVRLESFIRQNLTLTFHEQSTLRMARSAAQGVVNARGEVFGVEDLIVADNSIIPFTVDGNTSAPSYLIGLTIAGLLLRH
ncbi:MAG: GMC family oxidoreductase [Bacillota bacterium]